MRTQVVRTAEDESISHTVVMAVAEATDANPLTLDPKLSEIIDPDALNRLFSGREVNGEVAFTMGECRVRVQADGRVVVSATMSQQNSGTRTVGSVTVAHDWEDQTCRSP
jgi:hypothetical protein